jgi:hypothetical protein
MTSLTNAKSILRKMGSIDDREFVASDSRHGQPHPEAARLAAIITRMVQTNR